MALFLGSSFLTKIKKRLDGSICNWRGAPNRRSGVGLKLTMGSK